MSKTWRASSALQRRRTRIEPDTDRMRDRGILHLRPPPLPHSRAARITPLVDGLLSVRVCSLGPARDVAAVVEFMVRHRQELWIGPDQAAAFRTFLVPSLLMSST